MRPKFQFDEQFHTAVAEGLRRRGIDVVTATEAGLRSASDNEVIAHALTAGRVLVTHDDDFTAFHHQGVAHAGIAYCAPHRRSIGQLVEALVLIHEVMEAEEMVGRLEYL
ncbi:MAG: hypothetical protein DCC58_15740 [Chloroflexi bacterium]|nr:MAG: hypothetical protein DCC58_15740 [Chloroflexota bacterium]